MEDHERNLSNSCLNLALKKTDYFMSAFPGKVVFGKCTPNAYKKKQFFEFEVFALYKLYLAIFDIIEHFANEKNLSHKLIQSNFQVNYFFSVKTVMNYDKSLQIAQFGIEENDEITFQMFLTDTEMNSFIYTLVKIIPFILCMNPIEQQIFENASKQTVKEIYELKNEEKCGLFARNFLTQINKIENHAQLTIFLNYYCEIILVFQKLKSLINEEIEFDNVAAIVSKMTEK